MVFASRRSADAEEEDGGEYKRHVDLKRREIPWNDDCELPSESRNKKIRKKLSFTEGNCKRCFIRKLNPEFW